MQTQLQEQLSISDAEIILGRLPERISKALIARAAEIEYPTAARRCACAIEAVVEMAIASFLATFGSESEICWWIEQHYSR
jgi:hypothetical protein